MDPRMDTPEPASHDGDLPCWRRIGVWGADEPRCPELVRVIHCRNCDVFRAGGARLFDHVPPEGYGTEWLEALAQVPAPPPGRVVPVLIFSLAGERLALPLETVVSVLEPRPVRRVPHHQDPVLLGLAQVEGEMCLCVSLSTLFDATPRETAAAQPAGLLLALGAGRTEWIAPVEKVAGLADAPVDALEAVPSTLFRSAAAFVQGLFVHDGERVGLIDGELLLGALRRRIG
jgi:chemotaxis-related protein WspD